MTKQLNHDDKKNILVSAFATPDAANALSAEVYKRLQARVKYSQRHNRPSKTQAKTQFVEEKR